MLTPYLLCEHLHSQLRKLHDGPCQGHPRLSGHALIMSNIHLFILWYNTPLYIFTQITLLFKGHLKKNSKTKASLLWQFFYLLNTSILCIFIITGQIFKKKYIIVDHAHNLMNTLAVLPAWWIVWLPCRLCFM